MPVFNFSDKYSELERRVFRTACRLACRELGVEDRPESIYITPVDMGPKHKGIVTRLPNGDFSIMISEHEPPYEVVFSLLHELIHFWQYCRGDLNDDFETNEAIWKGKRYKLVNPMVEGDEAYLNQPWEVEAFAMHQELFQKVVVGISPIDRDRVTEEWEARGGPFDHLIRALGNVIIIDTIDLSLSKEGENE